MAIPARFIQITSLCTLLFSFSALAEQTLSIERAVEVALERDVLTIAYQSRRDAYYEQSIAEDTLPDPKIKFGLVNVPTDTYKRNQEPMTQVQLGIQQVFPRGNSLKINSQRTLSMSMAEAAKTENQRRQVMRDVRETWLELFYWINAERIVSENRNLFGRLVSVTKQQYAAGRQKQQDVIRSELELGMLDDRKLEIKTRIEIARALLEKYIGHNNSKMILAKNLPTLKPVPRVASWVEKHPMMNMEQSMVNTGEQNIELAKQAYKPSWMLDLTYGKRENAENGTKRADFVSAMVIFDLPLFTADRQDKSVAASKLRLNSAINAREERMRELTRMWQENIVKEKQLLQRREKYKTLLLPKAGQNTKAALFSYQSGRGAFTELMRAQITELETQLRALRLDVDHKKAQAQLRYFVGEI
jgi:outer membrane protein TolC